MTFEEWYMQPVSREEREIADQDGNFLRVCWQAAQREAARRCAEICRTESSIYKSDPPAWEFIEREFGLDKS